jgi:RNAse (barnase) inhibitor barstar
VIRILGPEVSVADVVREAQRDGDHVSVVPAGATKAESLDLFAEVLRFPDWFGRNLDALADCLHDFAEEPLEAGRLRHLVWDGVALLRRSHPESYQDLTGVLAEVTEDHDAFVVTVLDR